MCSSGSARRTNRQTVSSSISEPFARMLRTSSIIAAKTGMGLAPGLTRLDVSDWRHCTLAPRVDALYVSTSARHPAAGEEAWRKVPRSPLSAIARERMFQAMKCFCTFSWGLDFVGNRNIYSFGKHPKQAVKLGQAEKVLLPS